MNINEQVATLKNESGYKASAFVEKIITDIIESKFSDYIVISQCKAIFKSNKKSNMLFCKNFNVSERKRKFDIVIENPYNNKKHIIEIKHQSGGGTAIDSVAIFLEEINELKEYTNSDNPFSLIITDFIPTGIHGDWNKKYTMPNCPTYMSRFNDYADNHNVPILLIDELDDELINLFCSEIKERLK